jgi:hypothetical protein
VPSYTVAKPPLPSTLRSWMPGICGKFCGCDTVGE